MLDALPFTALSFALTAVPASAHQPWFNEGTPDPERPYALRTPIEISQVVYGGFTGPDQVDDYAFTAPTGFAIELNLVVADDPDRAAFRPAFTPIGPGVKVDDQPEAVDELAPPAGLPAPADGEGVVTISGGEWGTFFEPFARVNFVAGPEFAGGLAGGDYLVAVFDPDGGSGSYGLTLGGREEIGGQADFFARFPAWPRCEPVRSAVDPAAGS